MVQLLQVVCDTLKEIDIQRQAEGGPSCFWIMDGIEDYTKCVTANEKFVSQTPLECFHLVGMYTRLEHSRIKQHIDEALQRAWEYQGNQGGGSGLLLGVNRWSWRNGFTKEDIVNRVQLLLDHCYTCDGERIAQQMKGILKGTRPGPQFANQYCYPIEKHDELSTRLMGIIRRFIVDLWTRGARQPSAKQYHMEYKATSARGGNVVHLGVHTVVREGRVHTAWKKRECEYPSHPPLPHAGYNNTTNTAEWSLDE